ncbi:uncharacterized protein [Musca autumnalis]|uniref:uncharacterized protein n=1 Tax=Musca autumnalis TaxID=221902 RepID=UPI003CF6CB34
MKKRKKRKTNPSKVDEPRKRFKDHDLRICTWNVRTLYREGAVFALADVLGKYKADITAIQEIRWTGKDVTTTPKGDALYYSCHDTKHEFGCGFVVGRRLKHLVSSFTPVNERLATIRFKAKFFNISFICAHAPTEDKDEQTKDIFYESLEETYDRCPAHDIKIVLGDFNAKIGKENIFGQTVGKFSLHSETSDNGMRLIDFAAAKNMVVSSTRFKHLDIHKGTWLSPDQRTINQIDHVVIDGRHSSSVLDVRSFRGANIDSDHYLVAAKVRTRLNVANKARTDTTRKLDIAKLQTQQIATAYSTQLTQLLNDSASRPDNISAQWQNIAHSMQTAAKSVLGYQRPPPKNPWYDQECRAATEEKNAAYRTTLQSVATRSARERYREKRREEKRLFRRKKREMEKRECEQMEMYRRQNEVRKFYQRVKHQTDGFGTGISSCRDQQGNLVTDTDSVLRIWKEHFSKLLVSDSSEDGEDTTDPIPDDGIECIPPSQDEVRTAINRLKNNKAAGADGLPAELFKTGGDTLIRCMHQLVSTIWQEERVPDDWNVSILCPVHKKGDKTVCSNYRGISLLPIAYKIVSGILCERLKPMVNEIIGPYQCGFRPGKSTIDQIFTLRQILEKTQEMQIDTFHLFVDYKAAFDSPIRSKVFQAMSDFGIPAKLIRLCRMTLTETRSSVKIGKNLSEEFTTKRGFRQGDGLSCDLFNILLEKVIRDAKVKRNGTIYTNSHMLLAYADDIDIMGRSVKEVTDTFAKVERESAKVGLAVNGVKTKLMVSTRNMSINTAPSVNVGTYNFEVVKDFVYLGTAINTTNNISCEIRRRIVLANRCYFGLSKQFRNKATSRQTKITLYKTLILPVLMYGSEAWVLAQADKAVLCVFERKILRKIYGPICVDGEYRRRMNIELYQLYNDINIVERIEIQRLRWLGHVIRMSDDEPAKKAYKYGPHGGSRRSGRPKLRWSEQVKRDITKLHIPDWENTAANREDWRFFLSSAYGTNVL